MLFRSALIFGLVVVLSSATATRAALLTQQVVVGEASALNAWPGPDGEVGTGDDLVDGSNSPISGSDPNSIGSYSYNAFDFGGGVPETTRLPNPMDAVTFLQGTVTVDTTVAGAGGGSIVSDWHVMGTEPFQFHGPYEAQIITVNSGTYDPVTRAFTMNMDFLADLAGGMTSGLGFDLSGVAYQIDSADFGTATGNTYVDTVLIPLAQGLGAPSLFYMRAQGIVPASSGGKGFFPSFPIDAAIVAVPEPGASLLAFAALGTLAGLRRWSRA